MQVVNYLGIEDDDRTRLPKDMFLSPTPHVKRLRICQAVTISTPHTSIRRTFECCPTCRCCDRFHMSPCVLAPRLVVRIIGRHLARQLSREVSLKQNVRRAKLCQ